MKEHPFAKRKVALKPRPSTPNPEGAFNSLKPDLLKAIRNKGYHTPSPIQEQAIPLILEGRDLIGSAQTGTGKTAAFTLPLLQQLMENPMRPKRGTPRALILAPTRELAAQICDSIEDYGKYTKMNHTVVYGGVSQFHQVKALNRGVDILVATPGRLLDLMNQGYIHIEEVEHFILDEVDRMLDMGFIPDIERIMKALPPKRQTLFFSATLSRKIEELAYRMVNNPARITIEPDKPAVDRIRQTVFFVDKNNKEALLTDLLRNNSIKKAIIFTQMKHSANTVAEKLAKRGVNATAIHGNKSQAARTRALDGFKRGRFEVLVATDVAARGLDVDDITHVINYDLPMDAETYVHRIGRTARAGAEGDAISFCSADERAYLRDVERLLGNPVPYELDHQFHCEASYRSQRSAPRRPGGGGGGGRRGGRNDYNRRSNGGGGGGGGGPRRNSNNRFSSRSKSHARH
ncbi:DEAD/DEAH box helicase [bacterium]|nr:DEAD/DEAH box helicase [bacterium]